MEMPVFVIIATFVVGVAIGYVFNGILSLNSKQDEQERHIKRTCDGCKYLTYWNDGSVTCTHTHGNNCLKSDERPLKT